MYLILFLYYFYNEHKYKKNEDLIYIYIYILKIYSNENLQMLLENNINLLKSSKIQTNVTIRPLRDLPNKNYTYKIKYLEYNILKFYFFFNLIINI